MALENGWIKLHRKSRKSAVMQNQTAWFVWCHLLIDANIEDRKLWDGKEVKRGSLVIGLRKYAEEIGVSVRQLRTALSGLERIGNIDTLTDTRGTIINICNYSVYQQPETTADTPSDTPATHRRHTADTPATHGRHIDKKDQEREEGKERQEAFIRFWDLYPSRNDRKAGKAEAKVLFGKLPHDDVPSVMKAVENYRDECGDFAKDPARFLKKDFWRDFVDAVDPDQEMNDAVDDLLRRAK